MGTRGTFYSETSVGHVVNTARLVTGTTTFELLEMRPNA